MRSHGAGRRTVVLKTPGLQIRLTAYNGALLLPPAALLPLPLPLLLALVVVVVAGAAARRPNKHTYT